MSIVEELRAKSKELVAEAMRNVTIHFTEDGEIYSDNFSVSELRCKCDKCRKLVPHKLPEETLRFLQVYREELGRGFVPTSAYRCPEHPEEKKKKTPGKHNTEGAMDVPVSGGAQRYDALSTAILLGATGVGVANGFVHVDRRDAVSMAWKY